MKHGPVTKIEKRKKKCQKKFDDDVMSVNCEIIVIFSIYGQFGAIRKPGSGRIVCKTYILLIAAFYLTKTENRIKKSLIQLPHYSFE